jgi:FAD/FMN-containing dehydrogenase
LEHIADGDVHFNLVRHAAGDYHPVQAVALHDHVVELAVRDFGASFSGEQGIGRANQTAYDHFIPALVQRYSAVVAAVFARVPAAAVLMARRFV